jgi:anti-anti-sigma factor
LRLQVEFDSRGDIGILRLLGRIVRGSEAECFRVRVQDALAQYRFCILNLSEVRRMDAHGLGVMVWLCAEARTVGRSLKVACIPGRIYELCRLSGVIGAMEIYSSEDAAIESCWRAA